MKDYNQDAIDEAASKLSSKLKNNGHDFDSYPIYLALDHLVCSGCPLEEAVTGIEKVFFGHTIPEK